MELSSLFSLNTDNLFKFLFINGIILVVISLFYPLQKKQDLEIEIINYDHKVAIINFKISKLENEVKLFDSSSKTIEEKINSLKLKSSESTILIKDLKSKFNNTFDSLKKSNDKLKMEQLNISADKSKIKILVKHAEEYRRYSNWFSIVGLISFIIGLIGWSITTHTNESFKKEELKKLRRENNE